MAITDKPPPFMDPSDRSWSGTLAAEPAQRQTSSGNVKAVLEAIRAGKQIYPDDRKNTLSLITNRRLGPGDDKFVEEIQEYLEKRFDVVSTVVGGGRGCSRLILKVEGRDGKEAEDLAFRLLKRMMKCPETRDFLLRQKEVVVAASETPYARWETRSEKLEVIGHVDSPLIQNNTDKSVKVGPSQGSQIVVGSKDVEQRQLLTKGLPKERKNKVDQRFEMLDAIRDELTVVLENEGPATDENRQKRERVFSTFDKVVAEISNVYNRNGKPNNRIEPCLADFKNACLEMRPNSNDSLNQFNRTKKILGEIQRLLSKPDPEAPTAITA